MQNRARIAVIVLAAIAALACLIPLGIDVFRAASRPPVVVTMPPGSNNPPLPYASAGPAALNASALGGDTGGNPPTPAAVPDAASPAPTPPAPNGATLYIHVAGAVRRPGVYQLADGSRVFNAVHAAGGALPTGDTNAVNLAEKLDDGEKVTIPLKGQSGDFDADTGITGGSGITGGDSAVDVNASGPAIKSSRGGSDARPRKGRRSKKRKSTATAASGAAVSGGRSSKITQGTIDINTADAAQLERLPGVGPAMAARILRARHALGGFQSPSDLLFVPGLAQGKYNAMEPFVRI